MPAGDQFWKSPFKKYTSPYIRKVKMGYESRRCSLCDAKPIYRAGRQAYCRLHKAEAVKYWAAKPVAVSGLLVAGINPMIRDMEGNIKLPRKTW